MYGTIKGREKSGCAVRFCLSCKILKIFQSNFSPNGEGLEGSNEKYQMVNPPPTPLGYLILKFIKIKRNGGPKMFLRFPNPKWRDLKREWVSAQNNGYLSYGF